MVNNASHLEVAHTNASDGAAFALLIFAIVGGNDEIVACLKCGKFKFYLLVYIGVGQRCLYLVVGAAYRLATNHLLDIHGIPVLSGVAWHDAVSDILGVAKIEHETVGAVREHENMVWQV